ncbi:MAG: SDR family oxidoreductase [Bacteroidales bacterium]|nr:SDR family oxidoreductase [Bacteroidales bacterium]
MKILLTGANGYIGRRLLTTLLNSGHHVVCCVRDKNRFDISKYPHGQVEVIEVDFLDLKSLEKIPGDIDVAYYLIHSMSASTNDFASLEKKSAENFRDAIHARSVRQVIYLSGIINNKELSKHLASRKAVEEILKTGSYHLTTLRAGIVIGSGSASFEIMRDLVEKLPLMVAPRWLNTKSQPIAVQNVIEFLTGVMLKEETYDNSYDIGGPDILTYKQMLLKFAKVRRLKRKIIVVPVMTPKLSSYWLYFITSTSYKLAVNLVNSMKVEVVGEKNSLPEMLDIDLLSYEEAVKSAFDKIEQQEVISSWTDALSTNALDRGISQLINVPVYGCYKDHRQIEIFDEEEVLNRILSIGGDTGWYYGNWLWGIRGFLDKLSGGVGLRRGRRSRTEISAGDALDFWRVIYADKKEKRLLLFAEMKLPGEAWLEFKIEDNTLYQTATFRPRGLWGRAYWFSVMPFHGFIFRGMINRIAAAGRK